MNLEDFRTRLEQGLAGELLADLSNAIIQHKNSKSLAVPAVLASLVASVLADEWRGPVPAQGAQLLTRRFSPAFNQMIDALDSDDKSLANRSSEALASAYLAWLADQS